MIYICKWAHCTYTCTSKYIIPMYIYTYILYFIYTCATDASSLIHTKIINNYKYFVCAACLGLLDVGGVLVAHVVEVRVARREEHEGVDGVAAAPALHRPLLGLRRRLQLLLAAHLEGGLGRRPLHRRALQVVPAALDTSS
jgi:hypothetical protein